MQYQFAENDGSLVVEEYDEATRLTQGQVKDILRDMFSVYGRTVSIADEMEEVYKITYSENDEQKVIYVSAKPATPGGRGNALLDEHRILQLPKYLNYAYDKSQAGEKAISLGIYNRNGSVIVCAWKVAHSNAAENNRVSKQIKIRTIAKAMQEGFVQQDRGANEYICAFRKEFIYFYINNVEWLHGTTIDHLAEEKLPETSGTEVNYCTEYFSNFARNRILFGAPGTGKSFTLNTERKLLLGEDNETDYERVTFHPDYSYANFVGTYKPVPCKDDNGHDAITYEYVPGPFMRVYVKALQNSRADIIRPFLLIVEEINRANVAAVFGDIFQLLDRGNDEVSEYPIEASEDIKNYLAKELGGTPDNYSKIKIPDNMFIWATMNSADQGVFPMDTAFKRRWDFTYLGINESERGIRGKTVVLGQGENARVVEWNDLRHEINNRLSVFKINEDKLLGPYFLSSKIVPENGEIDIEQFTKTFKNKVIMYLFDDAAKQKRASLFADGIDTTKYSAVCGAFDAKGVFTFCTEISNKFTVIPTNGTSEAKNASDAVEG